MSFFEQLNEAAYALTEGISITQEMANDEEVGENGQGILDYFLSVVQSAKNLHGDLKKEMGKLDERNSRLREAEEDLIRRRESLESRENAQAVLSELGTKLEALGIRDKEVTDLVVTQDQLRKRMVELDQQGRDLVIEEITRLRSNAVSSLKELTDGVTQLRTSADTTNSDLGTRLGGVDQVLQGLSTFQSQFLEDVRAAAQSLGELNAALSRVTDLTAANGLLAEEKGAADAEVTRLQLMVDNLQGQLTGKDEVITDQTNRINQSLSARRVLTEDYSAMFEDLDSTRQSLDSTRRSLEARDDLISDLNTGIDQLRAQLGTSHEKAETDKNTIEQMRTDLATGRDKAEADKAMIEQFRIELATGREKAETDKATINQLQGKLDASHDRADTDKATISQLQTELATGREKAKTDKATIEQLRAELRTAEKEAHANVGKLGEKIRELATAQESLEASRVEVQGLAVEVRDLNRDVEQLERRISEKDEEIQRRTEEAANEATNANATARGLLESNRKLEEEVKTLTKEKRRASVLLGPLSKRQRFEGDAEGDDEDAEGPDQARGDWVGAVYEVTAFLMKHQTVVQPGSSLTQSEAAATLCSVSMTGPPRDRISALLHSKETEWYCLQQLSEHGKSSQRSFIRDDGSCAWHNQCVHVRVDHQEHRNIFIFRRGEI
ncbi:hypothetical protein F4818DRAFT_416850 [Hypoxylon cercidicola]|nr:hypothetical protein F4818DRAFT_416850 [Hypoxylon cercidicola]